MLPWWTIYYIHNRIFKKVFFLNSSKPCMEIVLWKPPPPVLTSPALHPSPPSNTSHESNNSNANNTQWSFTPSFQWENQHLQLRYDVLEEVVPCSVYCVYTHRSACILYRVPCHHFLLLKC